MDKGKSKDVSHARKRGRKKDKKKKRRTKNKRADPKSPPAPTSDNPIIQAVLDMGFTPQDLLNDLLAKQPARMAALDDEPGTELPAEVIIPDDLLAAVPIHPPIGAVDLPPLADVLDRLGRNDPAAEVHLPAVAPEEPEGPLDGANLPLYHYPFDPTAEHLGLHIEHGPTPDGDVELLERLFPELRLTLHEHRPPTGDLLPAAARYVHCARLAEHVGATDHVVVVGAPPAFFSQMPGYHCCCPDYTSHFQMAYTYWASDDVPTCECDSPGSCENCTGSAYLFCDCAAFEAIDKIQQLLLEDVPLTGHLLTHGIATDTPEVLIAMHNHIGVRGGAYTPPKGKPRYQWRRVYDRIEFDWRDGAGGVKQDTPDDSWLHQPVLRCGAYALYFQTIWNCKSASIKRVCIGRLPRAAASIAACAYNDDYHGEVDAAQFAGGRTLDNLLQTGPLALATKPIERAWRFYGDFYLRIRKSSKQVIVPISALHAVQAYVSMRERTPQLFAGAVQTAKNALRSTNLTLEERADSLPYVVQSGFVSNLAAERYAFNEIRWNATDMAGHSYELANMFNSPLWTHVKYGLYLFGGMFAVYTGYRVYAWGTGWRPTSLNTIIRSCTSSIVRGFWALFWWRAPEQTDAEPAAPVLNEWLWSRSLTSVQYFGENAAAVRRWFWLRMDMSILKLLHEYYARCWQSWRYVNIWVSRLATHYYQTIPVHVWATAARAAQVQTSASLYDTLRRWDEKPLLSFWASIMRLPRQLCYGSHFARPKNAAIKQKVWSLSVLRLPFRPSTGVLMPTCQALVGYMNILGVGIYCARPHTLTYPDTCFGPEKFDPATVRPSAIFRAAMREPGRTPTAQSAPVAADDQCTPQHGPTLFMIGFHPHYPAVSRTCAHMEQRGLISRAIANRPDAHPGYWESADAFCENMGTLPSGLVNPTPFHVWIERFAGGERAALERGRDLLHHSQVNIARACRHKTFIKKECVPKFDKSGLQPYQPRVIQGCHPEFTVATGPFAHAASKSMMHHKGRVRYAAGWTAGKLDSWFAKVHNNLSCYPLAYIKIDAVRLDASVRPECRKFLNRVYKRWGLKGVGLALLKQNARKCSGWTRCGHYYEVDGTVGSGETVTTLGNTVATKTVIDRAIVEAMCLAECVVAGDDAAAIVPLHQLGRLIVAIEKHYALAGFEPTLAYGTDPLDLEFCSGRWWPSTGRQAHAFGPKPGKLLRKIGFATGPDKCSKPPRHARGIAIGLRNLSMHVPVINDYLGTILRLTEGHVAIAPAEMRQVEGVGGVHESELVADAFRYVYDIDPAELQDLRQQIRRVDRLPTVITSRVFDKLVIADSPAKGDPVEARVAMASLLKTCLPRGDCRFTVLYSPLFEETCRLAAPIAVTAVIIAAEGGCHAARGSLHTYIGAFFIHVLCASLISASPLFFPFSLGLHVGWNALATGQPAPSGRPMKPLCSGRVSACLSRHVSCPLQLCAGPSNSSTDKSGRGTSRKEGEIGLSRPSTHSTISRSPQPATPTPTSRHASYSSSKAQLFCRAQEQSPRGHGTPTSSCSHTRAACRTCPSRRCKATSSQQERPRSQRTEGSRRGWPPPGRPPDRCSPRTQPQQQSPWPKHTSPERHASSQPGSKSSTRLQT